MSIEKDPSYSIPDVMMNVISNGMRNVISDGMFVVMSDV